MSIEIDEVSECGACGALYVNSERHSDWHARQPGELFEISRHLRTCPYGRWIEQSPVGEYLGPCDCGVIQ